MQRQITQEFSRQFAPTIREQWAIDAPLFFHRHNPKTGGTAVNVALVKHGLDVFGNHRWKTQKPQTEKQIIEFSIYRDPVDRAICLYRFARSNSFWHNANLPHPLRHELSELSFDDYISNLIDGKYNSRAWGVEPQSEHLTGCPFILDFSCLESDLNALLGKFNVPPLSLLRVNDNTHHRNITISEETRKKIENHYHMDYQFKP